MVLSLHRAHVILFQAPSVVEAALSLSGPSCHLSLSMPIVGQLLRLDTGVPHARRQRIDRTVKVTTAPCVLILQFSLILFFVPRTRPATVIFPLLSLSLQHSHFKLLIC